MYFFFFSVGIDFHLVRVNIKELDCWIIMVRICLVCKKLPHCLPKWEYHLHSQRQSVKLPCCSSCQHLVMLVFWILAIMIGAYWYTICFFGVKDYIIKCHLPVWQAEMLVVSREFLLSSGVETGAYLEGASTSYHRQLVKRLFFFNYQIFLLLSITCSKLKCA